VEKTDSNSELVSYELEKDNPLHCLTIQLGNGFVAIYPDGISVIPEGKDGFSIAFKKEIPFKVLKAKECEL